MFSTCSPIRPNPIGMSVVEVLGIRDANLDARRLDMLDGTPMLDIKPQLHSCCTPLYAVMLGTAHMGSAVYVRISSCFIFLLLSLRTGYVRTRFEMLSGGHEPYREIEDLREASEGGVRVKERSYETGQRSVL